MKPFLVPSACGAVVAATSLVFYALFDRVFGSAFLGMVIIVQSVAAILQMTVVPQSWLYVMAAPDRPELERRYALSMLIELITGAAGTILALGLTFLPIRVLSAHRWELVLIFLGLWAAGSTSHQGFLRARLAWTRYTIYILWPAFIRLAFILTAALLPRLGITVRWSDWSVAVIGALFFVPEASRYAVAQSWGLSRHGQRFPGAEMVAALRRIAHNWLFDLGSGFIENADKLLVGWLVSPTILVVYFFARRIGGAITIAIEPLYAELYRRIEVRRTPHRRRDETLAWLIGAAVAAVAAGGLALLFIGAELVPAVARYIPASLTANPAIFVTLLLIDAGVSVNRWARFLYQEGFGSTFLLFVRLGLRGIFGLALLAGASTHVNEGIVYAYLLMFVCESAFVAFSLARRHRGPRLSPLAGIPAEPMETDAAMLSNAERARDLA